LSKFRQVEHRENYLLDRIDGASNDMQCIWGPNHYLSLHKNVEYQLYNFLPGIQFNSIP
jgi:hypothetical protein